MFWIMLQLSLHEACLNHQVELKDIIWSSDFFCKNISLADTETRLRNLVCSESPHHLLTYTRATI